jgi:hypothetical protein
MLPLLTATRYVTPFKEGGSLPALVEADDGQMYVMKFAGAGQGRKALIAELVAGEIGRSLGLRVPGLALLNLDPSLGATEPDPEIRDLLKASVGINLGLRFLPNAFEYNPMKTPPLTRQQAAQVVWFDAYVTNVDRTPRNVNMLIFEKQLWLIDHGASMYFHHSADWHKQPERSRTPFKPIKDHALLPYAGPVTEADATLRPRLTAPVIDGIVAAIPDEWLRNGVPAVDARAGYVRWLSMRLEQSAVFVEEAESARAQRV